MNWIKQCEELWGERWKSTLALTAGVKKRQVFRWFAGDTKLPIRVEQGIKNTHEIWVKNNPKHSVSELVEIIAKSDEFRNQLDDRFNPVEEYTSRVAASAVFALAAAGIIKW